MSKRKASGGSRQGKVRAIDPADRDSVPTSEEFPKAGAGAGADAGTDARAGAGAGAGASFDESKIPTRSAAPKTTEDVFSSDEEGEEEADPAITNPLGCREGEMISPELAAAITVWENIEIALINANDKPTTKTITDRKTGASVEIQSRDVRKPYTSSTAVEMIEKGRWELTWGPRLKADGTLQAWVDAKGIQHSDTVLCVNTLDPAGNILSTTNSQQIKTPPMVVIKSNSGADNKGNLGNIVLAARREEAQFVGKEKMLEWKATELSLKNSDSNTVAAEDSYTLGGLVSDATTVYAHRIPMHEKLKKFVGHLCESVLMWIMSDPAARIRTAFLTTYPSIVEDFKDKKTREFFPPNHKKFKKMFALHKPILMTMVANPLTAPYGPPSEKTGKSREYARTDYEETCIQNDTDPTRVVGISFRTPLGNRRWCEREPKYRFPFNPDHPHASSGVEEFSKHCEEVFEKTSVFNVKNSGKKLTYKIVPPPFMPTRYIYEPNVGRVDVTDAWVRLEAGDIVSSRVEFELIYADVMKQWCIQRKLKSDEIFTGFTDPEKGHTLGKWRGGSGALDGDITASGATSSWTPAVGRFRAPAASFSGTTHSDADPTHCLPVTGTQVASNLALQSAEAEAEASAEAKTGAGAGAGAGDGDGGNMINDFDDPTGMFETSL